MKPWGRRGPWAKGEGCDRPSYHHGNLKEALVEAARRFIAERGLGGFTLADAAKWVGVSPAAHSKGGGGGIAACLSMKLQYGRIVIGLLGLIALPLPILFFLDGLWLLKSLATGVLVRMDSLSEQGAVLIDKSVDPDRYWNSVRFWAYVWGAEGLAGLIVAAPFLIVISGVFQTKHGQAMSERRQSPTQAEKRALVHHADRGELP